MKRVRPPDIEAQRPGQQRVEPAREALADFPWPDPVPRADEIDVVAAVRAERAERS